jgi:hypothetical protein
MTVLFHETSLYFLEVVIDNDFLQGGYHLVEEYFLGG